jgi:uncharacterized repeat protein (TIGR01451 family)
MSNTFAITTATNSVILNDERQGEVSFTVANASGRQLPARAHIVPQGEAQADWFTLAGESEREFAIAGVQQYTVRIQVPPEAAAGNYLFRLDAVGIRVPDEEFAEGPSVTFVVPEQVVEKRPFPWWIIVVIAAVVLLVGIGTAVYLLTRPPELVLTVTPSSDPAVAGEVLSYNISVTNNGRRTANQVVIESVLPEGVSFLVANECDYFESWQAVRCLLPEPLQRNDERSVGISVLVGGATRGVISYTVGLTSSDIEPTNAPLVTVGTAVTAEVDLTAEVSGPAAPVSVGSELNYLITIGNNGPSDVTNLTATYQRPTGMEVGSLTDNCQSDDGFIRCSLTALRAGESADVVLTLVPSPAAVGTLQDSFQIASSEAEVTAGPVSTQINPATGLSLSVTQIEPLSDALVVNEPFTYRLQVGNSTDRLAQNALLRYTVPNGLNVVEAEIVGVRTCPFEVTDRLLTCDLRDLAAGAVQTIRIRLQPTTAVTFENRFTLSASGFADETFSQTAVVWPVSVCSSGCPFNSIQTAVNAAADGSVIAIAAGTYFENLVLNQNVTLQGSRSGQTIINGGGAERVVLVPADRTVTLNRLIIQNGRAVSSPVASAPQPLAVPVASESPALPSAEIVQVQIVATPQFQVPVNPEIWRPDIFVMTAGTGADGSGIYNQGTLTLNRSTVRNNQTNSGEPSPLLGSGGRGGRGAGIFNAGTLTINQSTIHGNSTGPGGAGILAGSGGNGGDGAGIYNNGTLVVQNSTISDNFTGSGGGGGTPGRGGQGGGIYNAGTLTAEHVTLNGNSGSGGGGGIFNGGSASLRAVLIAGNAASSGPDCSGSFESQGYNLLGQSAGCSLTGELAGNLLNVNPLLGTLQNNGGPTLTHALPPDSPARNAVEGGFCPATDQRGQPRDALCDIGAFEVQ